MVPINIKQVFNLNFGCRLTAVNRIPLNQCAQCGAEIIAAAWSEHVSDRCVRNLWYACGYQFEDTVYLSARDETYAS
jgi:hypothetical protein